MKIVWHLWLLHVTWLSYNVSWLSYFNHKIANVTVTTGWGSLHLCGFNSLLLTFSLQLDIFTFNLSLLLSCLTLVLNMFISNSVLVLLSNIIMVLLTPVSLCNNTLYEKLQQKSFKESLFFSLQRYPISLFSIKID